MSTHRISDDGARASARASVDRPAMSAERWAIVEALLLDALEHPAAERAQYVARRTEIEAELRDEVQALLEQEVEDTFLAQPLWERAGAPESPGVPAEIGGYRLLERLGEGGMGEVFLAERVVDDVTMRVALKIIRRGWNGGELTRRFQVERRILASLDHPNIARLLDVGRDADGTAFLVMEYVAGVDLLAWLSSDRRSTDARLALFHRIGAAVRHAHQRLVVHRDLKPQNILVGADDAPKLLDFGIAKVLHADNAETTDVTEAETRRLTPSYAAPEQILGEPITTACDVHALGVLLYQMLCDVHPFAEAGRSRADVEARILHEDPPPPSARLTAEAAARRGESLASLRRRVRGELDTIVLTMLRKVPADRYGSVAEVLDDLDRLRRHEPIRARPHSAAYRLRKLVRRHHPLFIAAAIVVVVSATSIVALSRQANRLRASSARVAMERDKALDVRSFLLEMFGTTGPDQATGDSVTARALLDRRAALLASEMARRPAAAVEGAQRSRDAEMLSVLAEGYEKLGLLDEAEPLARRALELRTVGVRDAERTPADVMASHNQLGWIHHQQRRFDLAEPLLRRAVSEGRELYGAQGDPRLARALNDLGVLREARGDYAEAERLYRESLAIPRPAGAAPLLQASTTSNLAVILYRRGELPAAVEMGARALRLVRDALGDDHLRTTIVQANLASMMSVQGDHARAAAQHREILARRVRLLGDEHLSVASSRTLLANELIADSVSLDEARALLDRAADRQRAARQRDELASTLRVRGDLGRRLSRWDEAARDYSEALTLTRAVLGTAHERTGTLLSRLASIHARRGDTTRAIALQREAWRIVSAALGSQHRRSRELQDALSRLESAAR